VGKVGVSYEHVLSVVAVVDSIDEYSTMYILYIVFIILYYHTLMQHLPYECSHGIELKGKFDNYSGNMSQYRASYPTK
jgi:hypothetical protein